MSAPPIYIYHYAARLHFYHKMSSVFISLPASWTRVESCIRTLLGATWHMLLVNVCVRQSPLMRTRTHAIDLTLYHRYIVHQGDRLVYGDPQTTVTTIILTYNRPQRDVSARAYVLLILFARLR